MGLHSAGLIITLISSIHSKEINKENCINGAEISSKCSFEIRIKPPLTESLKCKLKFNIANNEMRFSNIKFRVKAQEDNKCPFFALDIYEENKRERLFSDCGGTHDPFNKTFYNVSLIDVFYLNQVLIDQETNLKMNLFLSDRKFCDELLVDVPLNKLHLIWIIAVILLSILSIIGILVVIMRCKRKGCFKKKRHDALTEDQFNSKSNNLSLVSIEESKLTLMESTKYQNTEAILLLKDSAMVTGNCEVQCDV